MYFSIDADGDGAQAVIERAGALAQTILRTDAPADLRQRVRLVRQLRGLEEVAFLNELQPVRNVVVDRTFPLAERIAAGKAAAGLLARPLGVELRVDLAELGDARLDGQLRRDRGAERPEIADSCRP